MLKNLIFAPLAASLVVLSAAACSSSEQADLGEDSGAMLDSGAADAPPGADEEDAAADESDANVEAGETETPTCSADGFCHTVLPPKSFMRDVWSAGDGVVWAAAWDHPSILNGTGKILRWGGTAWEVHFVDTKLVHAIWGSGPTDLWAGGDNGLYHGTGPSSDAITWTKVRSEPVTSIWGSSASDVWATSSTRTSATTYRYDGKVLHYRGPSEEGDGWEIDPISSSRPAAYRKVWGTSADDVWLGANEDNRCTSPSTCRGPRAFALRRRPDGAGGFAWSDASMPDFGGRGTSRRGSEFSGGGSVSAGSVWLMGNLSKEDPQYDVIFTGTVKTDGSGDYGWSDSTFGTCRGSSPAVCPGIWYSRAVWGTSANDVYVAGDFGGLRHWDGTSFSRVKTRLDKIPVTAAFYAMWGASSTELWVVGDAIALHRGTPNQP